MPPFSRGHGVPFRPFSFLLCRLLSALLPLWLVAHTATAYTIGVTQSVAGASAGAPFTQQPIVTIYDDDGEIATDYEGSVYVVLEGSPTGFEVLYYTSSGSFLNGTDVSGVGVGGAGGGKGWGGRREGACLCRYLFPVAAPPIHHHNPPGRVSWPCLLCRWLGFVRWVVHQRRRVSCDTHHCLPTANTLPPLLPPNPLRLHCLSSPPQPNFAPAGSLLASANLFTCEHEASALIQSPTL